MKKFFRRSHSLAFALLVHLSFSYAQQPTLKGTVYGVDGPLHGATVSVNKTILLTNKQGEFTFTLDPGHYILYITYTDYKKIEQEIKMDGANLSLQFTMLPDEEISEVTVMGFRFGAQRSNLSTPVPVDVISSRQLLKTGQTSLTQMLQYNVPSFNASRPLVNEPVTLRGLDPDQVLILVDGKRYHNTAWVNFGGARGILGRGAVSNDLNPIPFSAIEKIEVLRDGASAQYGSDAIAGVINIQLKNSVNKTSAQLHTGQFYKGDGETINLGINHGITFLKKGLLNFSGAFRFQNPTYRGGVYQGTVYKSYQPNATHDDSVRVKVQDDSTVQAKNFDRSKVSNAGSSKHVGYELSVNGTYPVNVKTELFWTFIFNHRTTTSISGYVFPKDVTRINPDLFPDGFGAKPPPDVIDVSAIAGIKREMKNKWQWEFSSTYGMNWVKFNYENSCNASQYFTLGKNAPTSFYLGTNLYDQLSNNVQLSKKIVETAKTVLNFATGAEWRLEHYRIKEGEEASWKSYDSRKLGGSGGNAFSPKDASSANQNVTAVYADLESEFNKRFLIGTAMRYEYYSDFGGNLAGKLAARYTLTKKISVRASMSNGFRAPSLQQWYYSQTRITPSTASGTYILISSGTFRNNSDVAKALGIPSLAAERSANLSGGFTASPYPNIRFTADAYWIQIKNRIVLSGIFNRATNSNVNELLRDITDVNQVQFFTNAINTRTKGLDIILNGNWKIRKAILKTMLAANFTQTRLFGEIKKAGNLKADSLNSNTLFGTEEKTRLEKGQPSDKILLSFNYQRGRIQVHLQNTRFGKTSFAPSYVDPKTRVTSFLFEFFSPKILTDISLTYSLKEWISLTFGANNIFDVYPDRMKDYRNTGEGMYIYTQETTSFGFYGGYYYLNLNFNF